MTTDGSQEFCLRWNNHQATIISVFDYLLENETLVDCTLAAEGQYLKAHKVVLCACSPYLELLLSQHNDKHPILIFKDIKFNELKSMIDYMYKGEVNIAQDQLNHFLKAAESLQIKGLSESEDDATPQTATPTPRPPPPRAPPAQRTQPRPFNNAVAIRSTGPSDVDPDSPKRIIGRPEAQSPTPRKRRRQAPVPGRPSLSGDDASNASEGHFDQSNCDVPTPAHSTSTSLVPSGDSEKAVAKVETNSELMLEPKTEYDDNSVEDITLDDDDEDYSQAGTSQMDNSQGNFGNWQQMVGDQTGDDVFSGQDTGAQNSQEITLKLNRRTVADLSVLKKSSEENEFETFRAESNEVSPLSMNTQVNQIVAFDNARHEQKNHVLNKDIAQTTGLKLYETKIDQLVMKDDRVDIKIVDKYQLGRKKKSTDAKHGSQKKSRNYSYDENDLKSHKKLLELVEMQKQLQNQVGSKQFDESHKQERSAEYNTSGSESNEIKQEPWSTQPIKQEEKTFNETSLNEKLPMNLSMKTEHTKHASVVENETHSFETNGPNGLINETVVKNHSLSLTTTKKTSKIQHDGNKAFSKVVEENSTVSKAVEKLCKDDIASENDLIREDPVCIYCYKKLPKDISNIIEHCRLCVYMLRPINIKYMCYMCLYNTHCRTGIKRHIMRHLNIRPYTCSICPFSGIVSRSLKLHMKTHTMEQLISLSDSERKNNSVESSEFADEFEHDPSMTGETRSQSENMRHLEAILDAPMSNMLNETLREPMLAVNIEHDAVNDSNNNTSLGNDKLDANMNKTESDAIDLTNNNNLSNSSEGTILNEKMTVGHSLYANNVSNFAFEELSLKGNSLSNVLGFATQSPSENGALDFCMKK